MIHFYIHITGSFDTSKVLQTSTESSSDFELPAFKRLVGLVCFIFTHPEGTCAVKRPFYLADFHRRICGVTYNAETVTRNATHLERCGIPAVEHSDSIDKELFHLFLHESQTNVQGTSSKKNGIKAKSKNVDVANHKRKADTTNAKPDDWVMEQYNHPPVLPMSETKYFGNLNDETLSEDEKRLKIDVNEGDWVLVCDSSATNEAKFGIVTKPR